MPQSLDARRLVARTFYRRAVEAQCREEAEEVKEEHVAEIVRANQIDAEVNERRKKRVVTLARLQRRLKEEQP